MRTSCRQNGQQFFFQQAFELVNILNLFAVSFIAQFVENLAGGGGAEVSGNECSFEIIERSTVNFLVEGNDFFDALTQVFPGARHRLFHALEKAGLLFFVQAAKKRLNHRERP